MGFVGVTAAAAIARLPPAPTHAAEQPVPCHGDANTRTSGHQDCRYRSACNRYN